jgi:hypothetical protein
LALAVPSPGWTSAVAVIRPGDAVVDLVEVLLVVTARCQAGHAAAYAIVARFKATRPQASIYIDAGPD